MALPPTFRHFPNFAVTLSHSLPHSPALLPSLPPFPTYLPPSPAPLPSLPPFPAPLPSFPPSLPFLPFSPIPNPLPPSLSSPVEVLEPLLGREVEDEVAAPPDGPQRVLEHPVHLGQLLLQELPLGAALARPRRPHRHLVAVSGRGGRGGGSVPLLSS